MMTGPDRQPWEHEGVRVEGGRLLVAGRDAEELAREHGTPLYVFDVTRVAEQARALRDALARAGLTPRVRLALKAQRAPEVLAALRALGAPGSPGAVGIDACSPGEVLHALDNGFTAAEISFTGTNVSERDLDVHRAGRRAREPRPAQPDRALRPPLSRQDHRPARQPARRRHARACREPVQRRPADQVRHLRGGSGGRPRCRAAPRPRHRHPARPPRQRACWTTSCPRSTPPSSR